MQAIVVRTAGVPEVMRLEEVEDPSIGAHDVLVEARSIGVNFHDLWVRQGAEAPITPGIEVAGVVVAVGDEATGVDVGDRVCGVPWYREGAYAELVAVPVSHTWKIPEGVELDLAAAIPLNYITAYASLIHVAQVRRGELVLIHAAAGGVGLAAVQLARRAGARVIATASSSKHAFLADQPGVEHVLDSQKPDWDDRVREHAGGGVDVVLDGVGEEGFMKSLRALRYGGRLSAFGYTSGLTDNASPPTEAMRTLEGLAIPFDQLFANGWSFAGITADAPPTMLASWMSELFAAVLRGELAPHIDARFPLGDAHAAHTRLHERRNIGKVLLEVE